MSAVNQILVKQLVVPQVGGQSTKEEMKEKRNEEIKK